MAQQTQRDGNLWEDDACEVFLWPDSQNEDDFYQLIINSHDVIYDAHGVHKDWNADVQVKSIVKDGVWVMEMRFAL